MWLGLFLTINLLVEAITGLLLSEPGLTGEPYATIAHENSAGHLYGQTETHSPGRELIQAIHEGQIAATDLRWVIDLTAIGLILLTISGLYLSVPFLKTRKRQR